MSTLLTLWAYTPGPTLADHGTLGRFTVGYDPATGFSVSGDGGLLKWRDDPPKSPPLARPGEKQASITLLGVRHVRFHASGWPRGEVPDLALRTRGEVPPRHSLTPERFPFAADRPDGHPDGDRILAYQRLLQTCAVDASFVRLTRQRFDPGMGRPQTETGQWLSFRLSLIDPALILSSNAAQSTSLDRAAMLKAAMAGLVDPPSPGIVGRLLPADEIAADLREAAERRAPYLAGGFRYRPDLTPPESFESVAVNATAPAILGATRLALDGTGKYTPERKDRWGAVAALDDGFWWAWDATDADPTRLALGDALARMPCFPPAPGTGGGRPVTTRLTQDAAVERAQVAALDMLGLTAAAVAATPPPGCSGGTVAPMHHLHMRMLADGTLEWRRWIAVECPSDPAKSSPVLLRVTRSPIDAGRDSQIDVRVEGLTDAHALAVWSAKVAAAYRDRAIRDGTTRGLTLLPDLAGAWVPADAAAGGRWTAHLRCLEPWDGAADLPASCTVQSAELIATRVRPAGPGGVRDLLGSPVPDPATAPIALTAARIDFAGLHSQSGDATLRFAGSIAVTFDAASLRFAIGRDGGWRLETPHRVTIGGGASTIRPVASPDTAGRKVAIGGLDVTFGDGPLPAFVVGIDPVAGDHDVGTGADLRLPVARVDVGGADRPDHDPSRQPLIWGDALMTRGTLGARDRRTTIDGERSVDFELQPESGGTGDRAAVTTLDPSPMMVALVSIERLAAPTATQPTLSTWSTGDAAWRITRPTDRPSEIILALPPQGVAEAWERATGAGSTLGPDQIADGARVPARLTATTILRVEGDERDRNAIAPWNVRTLFGARDVDLPGARLTAIDRFEALYGLEARLDRPERLRLAELTAWRGAPREPITRIDGGGTGLHDRRGREWRAAVAAWQRRLAMLDLRDERDVRAKPTIAGVRFTLRQPQAETGGLAGPRYVRPHGFDGFDDWWTAATEGGILGGALAGFERAEVIRRLLESPSGEGSIEGLQLSALGATTTLRAAFDDGLILISADVALGRISEARFERKGRIGALHHLAKHVIVYRRAFVPSRQFAPDQDAHLGRPIVRKVEEYIEITQPLRHYPDRAGATDISAGAMLGARFRTTRVPVDGGWASALVDPRVVGYSLPLWREAADAAVYPAPDVEILLAGPPADRSVAEDPVARRVASPHRLHFYSITATLGDAGATPPPGDVEAWPLIYQRDYVDRPSDTPVSQPITRADYGVDRPGVTLPPAAIEAPGFEPYTLLLEPGPPVDVMRGRSAKPMFADLRSILPLRAQTRTNDTAVGADARDFGRVVTAQSDLAKVAVLAQSGIDTAETLHAAASTALATMARTLGARLPRPGSGLDTAGLCAWAHEPVDRLDRVIARLDALDLSPTRWEAARATLLGDLRQAQSAIDALLPFDDTLRGLFQPLVDAAADTRDEIEDRLQREAEAGAAALDKQADDLIATLETRLIAPVRRLRDDIAGLDAAAAHDRFQREIGDAARAVGGARDAALARLPTLDRIAADITKAAARIAKPAPKASAAAVAIAARVAAIGKDVGDAITALDVALRTGLSAASTRIADWTNAAEDARTEVVAALDAMMDAAEDGIARLRAEIAAAQAVLRGIADTLVAMLETEIDNATAGIDTLPGRVAIDAPVRLASDAIAGVLRLTADARFPAEILATLDDQRALIVAEARALRSAIDTTAKTLCDYLSGPDDIARKLLEGWQEEIDRRLTDAIGQDLATLRGTITEIVIGADRALAEIRRGVEQALDDRFIAGLSANRVDPQGIGQAIALGLLRAAGAPPIVEQLAFNRDRIAYHFEERARVIVTPVVALVDQVDRGLKGVGMGLPTLGIGDNLLAPAHAAFDDLRRRGEDTFDSLDLKARDILKDFAGLKDMLPNLDFGPKLAAGLTIAHEVDAARRSGWLEARIAYGPETQDLFGDDGFAIVAEDMTLSGLSRYERTAAGGETRSVNASVSSHWRLTIGGIPLIRIRDAVIRYDQDQGLKFDIKPANVEFPGALQFLTRLLGSLNGGGSPLAVEVLLDDASGRPIGLRSRYDMPPTAFSAGAFAVFNAAFGIHLDLAQRSEFEIRSFAYFGRRDQPFAMTVSFLGGGGYLEAEAIHRPASRSTDLAVRLSIGAVAGTGFSFGPMRGSIQVYLGIEATYLSGAGGSRLAVSAVLILSGSVTVWGFVTVDLGVRLALTYDGSNLRGQGSVSVTVRISRFYKKSFKRAITYSL